MQDGFVGCGSADVDLVVTDATSAVHDSVRVVDYGRLFLKLDSQWGFVCFARNAIFTRAAKFVRMLQEIANHSASSRQCEEEDLSRFSRGRRHILTSDIGPVPRHRINYAE